MSRSQPKKFSPKKAMANALCKALRIDKNLADMWMTEFPKKWDTIVRATDLLLKYNVDPEILVAVESDWRERDWRGQKGQYPTAMQLVEHCLVYRKRLQDGRDALSGPDRIPWWQKAGLSVEECDAVIWKAEAARDPEFGKLVWEYFGEANF